MSSQIEIDGQNLMSFMNTRRCFLKQSVPGYQLNHSGT
jgi:hypothetical protein